MSFDILAFYRKSESVPCNWTHFRDDILFVCLFQCRCAFSPLGKRYTATVFQSIYTSIFCIVYTFLRQSISLLRAYSSNNALSLLEAAKVNNLSAFITVAAGVLIDLYIPYHWKFAGHWRECGEEGEFIKKKTLVWRCLFLLAGELFFCCVLNDMPNVFCNNNY